MNEIKSVFFSKWSLIQSPGFWILILITMTDYKWNWTIQLFETGNQKNYK